MENQQDHNTASGETNKQRTTTNNKNNNNNNTSHTNKKQTKRTFKNAIKSLIMLLNVGQKNRANNKQIKRVSLSVLVLGRQGTGKTALIKSLIGDEFTSDYCPTILDIYTKETIIDNMCVKFEFIDIAGSHSFPAMRKLYIERANVFLLVYDKDRESLDELVRLKNEIEEVRRTHISELSVAVIKSRCDIDHRTSSKRSQRSTRKKTFLENDESNSSASLRFNTDFISSSSASLLGTHNGQFQRYERNNFLENDEDSTSKSLRKQRHDRNIFPSEQGEENPSAPVKTRQSRRSQRTRKTSMEQEEEMISRWCGTIFKCSSKLGTNVAEIDEYLLSEGSFADSDTTTTTMNSISPSPTNKNGTSTAFSRHSTHRLSGRYIYGGRRNSRSIILNRSPLDDRTDDDRHSSN